MGPSKKIYIIPVMIVAVITVLVYYVQYYSGSDVEQANHEFIWMWSKIGEMRDLARIEPEPAQKVIANKIKAVEPVAEVDKTKDTAKVEKTGVKKEKVNAVVKEDEVDKVEPVKDLTIVEKKKSFKEIKMQELLDEVNERADLAQARLARAGKSLLAVPLAGIIVLLLVILMLILLIGECKKSSKLKQKAGGEEKDIGSKKTKVVEKIDTTLPNSAMVLKTLQDGGRLIDFLQEDIEQFQDAQIGAAVRGIHKGCKEILKENMQIVPVIDKNENSEVVIEEGFDPSTIRLVGNVTGNPPFKGVLKHKGWKIKELKIPTRPDNHDQSIIAPAEVEIS